MRTPISHKQYRRARSLIGKATHYLVLATEERLNLDPTTREAINKARTELSEAERLLLEQPAVERP